MRGLARFLLLCLGVALLLGCCLVGFVTAVGIGGVFVSRLGLAVLLGIPLALALFLGGMWLCVDVIDDLAAIDDPLDRVFFGSLVVAFLAMLVAFVPAVSAGPRIYQEHYGEQSTAVVTGIVSLLDEGGDVFEYQYFVRDDATGEDLGVLAQAPGSEAAEGDRIEVAVDPYGLVPPVAADRLGQTTVQEIILACCLAVVALAALAILATALGTLAAARLRKS